MSSDSLTVDQLAQVIAALTVGDRLNAKKDGTDDGEIITYRMMHRRARALGLTSADFDTFTDAVDINDLRRAQIKAAALIDPLDEAEKDRP